jgi:hypothetical protein
MNGESWDFVEEGYRVKYVVVWSSTRRRIRVKYEV